MHTVTLNIEDEFYPHFKAMIDSFVKTKQVELEYDYENNFPEDTVVSSIEEVRQRVRGAEQEESMSEEEYDAKMDVFFTQELGIKR